MMQPATPKVAVIVRSRNCADVLLQTLNALYSQEFTDFNLYVVDSGSTDGSVEVAKRFPCNFRSIKAGDYFPGHVLNEAVRETASEIAVFLNSDAVMLTPKVLGALLRPLSDARVQATFGRQLPRPDAETWVRGDLAKSFPAATPAPDWLPFALPIAAMRHSIWKKHPFYTEAWGSEDTEWGHWAKESGVEIRYIPEACVMHSHNYTLRQLYGRRFIEGEADAFIYRSHFSMMQMIGRYITSVAGGLILQWKARDLFGSVKLPILRFVENWAYYRGYRLGDNRLRHGNSDTAIGQREVLKRYDR